jgi:hypothetical protein
LLLGDQLVIEYDDLFVLLPTVVTNVPGIVVDPTGKVVPDDVVVVVVA